MTSQSQFMKPNNYFAEQFDQQMLCYTKLNYNTCTALTRQNINVVPPSNTFARIWQIFIIYPSKALYFVQFEKYE